MRRSRNFDLSRWSLSKAVRAPSGRPCTRVALRSVAVSPISLVIRTCHCPAATDESRKRTPTASSAGARNPETRAPIVDGDAGEHDDPEALTLAVARQRFPLAPTGSLLVPCAVCEVRGDGELGGRRAVSVTGIPRGGETRLAICVDCLRPALSGPHRR